MSRRYQQLKHFREHASYVLRHTSYPKVIVLAQRSYPSARFLKAIPDPHMYFQFVCAETCNQMFDWEGSRPLYAFEVDPWTDHNSLLGLMLFEALFTEAIHQVELWHPETHRHLVYTPDSFLRPRSSSAWCNQIYHEHEKQNLPTVLLPFEDAIEYHSQMNWRIDVRGSGQKNEEDSNRNDIGGLTKAANRRMSKHEEEALQLTTVMDHFLHGRPFRC
jgi:hypothetical protein